MHPITLNHETAVIEFIQKLSKKVLFPVVDTTESLHQPNQKFR